MKSLKVDPHDKCPACGKKAAKPGGCIACQSQTAYYEQGYCNKQEAQ